MLSCRSRDHRFIIRYIDALIDLVDSAAYFTSWGLHTSNYSIDQVPVESLTHLLYAYADVSVKTGAVHLTFPEADTDVRSRHQSFYASTKQASTRHLITLRSFQILQRNSSLLRQVVKRIPLRIRQDIYMGISSEQSRLSESADSPNACSSLHYPCLLRI